MRTFKFPSAYTILFVLIALVAGLSWIIPAGQYDMAMNAGLCKEVPVSGTYHAVTGNPQGLVDIFLAPIDGLYNHTTGQAGAIDVALFILIIGGFLGIVTKTGPAVEISTASEMTLTITTEHARQMAGALNSWADDRCAS